MYMQKRKIAYKCEIATITYTSLCEYEMYSGFPRDRNLTCVCKAMYNNLKGEATGDGFYGSASAMEPIYKGS